MVIYMRKLTHKFGAVRQEIDGLKFPSKLERDYYLHLKLLQKLGEVLFFLQQVPIHLPGGTKYVCDFQVFYKNGEVAFIDVKGVETDVFKVKKRLVEATYPFEIQVIKRGDFR